MKIERIKDKMKEAIAKDKGNRSVKCWIGEKSRQWLQD